MKWLSGKYEIGCATVCNVLLEHSCSRTAIQSSLMLAIETLLTCLKLTLPYQVNQKNTEIHGKKMQNLSKQAFRTFILPQPKIRNDSNAMSLILRRVLHSKTKITASFNYKICQNFH